MTKHAPESNEGDYAFYLPAAHKNDRPKDTWHIWQVRRVRLIDPLFISKTTVFLWQHSRETTFKLVQISVSSPCINSFRSKEGTRKGVRIVTQTMYASAHAHRHTQTQTPYPRTPLCRSDWIQNQNKTVFKMVSLRQCFLHHKEGGNTKRKEKLNWVWVQGQYEAVWTKVGDLPKNIYQLREKAPLSRPLQSCWKDGFL